ncbi:MAG TPA: polymer-forming cytoskeletal protein [Gammaproteobacteria bacterium]|nr:polymer-forming cytoskeletal protein [Gammaproteobacteria bacterium]
MERYPYNKNSMGTRASEVPSHALDAAATQKMSVFGKTLAFKGDLTASEDLLIQGRIEGSIKHSGSHLAIGAHGDVTGDVHAQRVIVQGKLEGDVHATESVVVEASANVRGDIYAPHVTLKEGAKFKGAIDMDAAEAAGANRRSRPQGDPGATEVDQILS